MSATLTAESLNGSVYEWVLQAIEQSDMPMMQKRRNTRIMTSPFRRNAQKEVTDRVTMRLLEEGEIMVLDDGRMAMGSFTDILKKIQEYLPMIIAFLSLFGL